MPGRITSRGTPLTYPLAMTTNSQSESSPQPRARGVAGALLLFGCMGLGLLAASSAFAQKSPAKGAPGFDFGTDRPDGSKLVTPSLVAERTALVPGETAWIGLRLEVEEGWHVYWRNNGDTGAPFTFDFETTGPVRIGEAHYPAPERYPNDNSLDYIYEDQVMVLFPVEVSAAARVGETVRIEGDIVWLVCAEICLVGEGAVSLQLPVRGESQASDEHEAFERTRERLPRPYAEARRAGVRVEWRGAELRIEAPGATELTFFPFEPSRSPQPTDPVDDAAAQADHLTIAYKDRDVRGAERVGGVLAIERDGESLFFEIETPGPAVGR